MFSFPDCENPLNKGCYYFKPQGSYDIQKPKRMFFKFTFVFTWLKLSVKKGSKQNKTKKNKDRYSATTSREAEPVSL